MIVQHSGQRIDSKERPLEAFELAISASEGAGSKSKAWDWLDDALDCLMDSPKFSERIDELENAAMDSSTNFPNTVAVRKLVNG